VQCPKCGEYQHKILSTKAVDAEADGSVHRIRRCTACAHTWRTREMSSAAISAITAQTSTHPLATALGVPLLDIEHEMESLLAPAITALREALAGDPNKVRADVAKYVVEDRRAHRRALAAATATTGVVPDDPAVRQLANLLHLLPPDPEGDVA